MKIKKGDNVIVMTGKDRGASGKVLKAMPEKEMLVIEGVNVKKKHIRRQQGGQGQIVEITSPVHVSNVMVVDPKTKKPSRVSRKKVGEKFVRIATKSGQEI